MTLRRVAARAIVAGTLLAPAGGGAAADEARETLTIETGSGSHAVAVEIADTPERRAVGLMHRPALAPDRGMLFDFGTTRPVTMWMKNTLISLDMFFIDRFGRIVAIAAETTPLSLKRIPSGAPVRFVLEMAGGSAARLGAAPGDRLRHPRFDRPDPAAPQPERR